MSEYKSDYGEKYSDKIYGILFTAIGLAALNGCLLPVGLNCLHEGEMNDILSLIFVYALFNTMFMCFIFVFCHLDYKVINKSDARHIILQEVFRYIGTTVIGYIALYFYRDFIGKNEYVEWWFLGNSLVIFGVYMFFFVRKMRKRITECEQELERVNNRYNHEFGRFKAGQITFSQLYYWLLVREKFKEHYADLIRKKLLKEYCKMTEEELKRDFNEHLKREDKRSPYIIYFPTLAY